MANQCGVTPMTIVRANAALAPGSLSSIVSFQALSRGRRTRAASASFVSCRPRSRLCHFPSVLMGTRPHGLRNKPRSAFLSKTSVAPDR